MLRGDFMAQSEAKSFKSTDKATRLQEARFRLGALAHIARGLQAGFGSHRPLNPVLRLTAAARRHR
jgi:hypothetical protein